MPQTCYFDVLQIEPTCDVEAIKSQYESLLKRFANCPSPELQKAYAVLSNAKLLNHYYDKYQHLEIIESTLDHLELETNIVADEEHPCLLITSIRSKDKGKVRAHLNKLGTVSQDGDKLLLRIDQIDRGLMLSKKRQHDRHEQLSLLLEPLLNKINTHPYVFTEKTSPHFGEMYQGNAILMEEQGFTPALLISFESAEITKIVHEDLVARNLRHIYRDDEIFIVAGANLENYETLFFSEPGTLTLTALSKSSVTSSPSLSTIHSSQSTRDLGALFAEMTQNRAKRTISSSRNLWAITVEEVDEDDKTITKNFNDKTDNASSSNASSSTSFALQSLRSARNIGESIAGVSLKSGANAADPFQNAPALSAIGELGDEEEEMLAAVGKNETEGKLTRITPPCLFFEKFDEDGKVDLRFDSLSL